MEDQTVEGTIYVEMKRWQTKQQRERNHKYIEMSKRDGGKKGYVKQLCKRKEQF